MQCRCFSFSCVKEKSKKKMELKLLSFIHHWGIYCTVTAVYFSFTFWLCAMRCDVFIVFLFVVIKCYVFSLHSFSWNVDFVLMEKSLRNMLNFLWLPRFFASRVESNRVRLGQIRPPIHGGIVSCYSLLYVCCTTYLLWVANIDSS